MAYPFSLLGLFVVAPSRVRSVHMPDALTLDLTTWIAVADMILADVRGAEASTCVVWFGHLCSCSPPLVHHENIMPLVAVGLRTESPWSRCETGP